jgi:hypothetical protein
MEFDLVEIRQTRKQGFIVRSIRYDRVLWLLNGMGMEPTWPVLEIAQAHHSCEISSNW